MESMTYLYLCTKATEGRQSGGADGGRTRDLLNAIQARSQLRHSPTMETLIVAKGRGQVNKTRWPGKGEEVLRQSNVGGCRVTRSRARV